MISMTGYGEASLETKKFSASFHINSINSRFLDVRMNLPRFLGSHEIQFNKQIKEYIKRGKVDVYLNFTRLNRENFVSFDEKILSAFVKQSKALSQKYKLSNDISISDFFQLKGVLNYVDYSLDEETIEKIGKLLNKALGSLVQMRKKEGQYIASDLKERLNAISVLVDKIKKEEVVLEKKYRIRLLEKAKLFKQEIKFDDNRLLAEIAILMGKSDVSEEITRLLSHIKQFHVFLKEKKPVGKKMDFLSQEMLRETNTIASKINQNSVINYIIDIKNYIEEIREQVQNIE